MAFLRLAEHAVLHLPLVVPGVEGRDRIGSGLEATKDAGRLSPLILAMTPPAFLSGFGERPGRVVKPAAHDAVVVLEPRNGHEDPVRGASAR